MILENNFLRWNISTQFFNKKCSPKLFFSIDKKIKKILIILDIAKLLLKSDFALKYNDFLVDFCAKNLTYFDPLSRNFHNHTDFILDDWQLENKIFALHCLDHILDNVQKQDLTKFGHADVIQSALFHVQVHRDIDVLSVAYDCTFKFLQKTIPVKEPAKYDAWDELTKKVGSMQFQNYRYDIFIGGYPLNMSIRRPGGSSKDDRLNRVNRPCMIKKTTRGSKISNFETT